jgi:hypothetical protein
MDVSTWTTNPSHLCGAEAFLAFAAPGAPCEPCWFTLLVTSRSAARFWSMVEALRAGRCHRDYWLSFENSFEKELPGRVQSLGTPKKSHSNEKGVGAALLRPTHLAAPIRARV